MSALLTLLLLSATPDAPAARENELELAFIAGVSDRLALGGLAAFDTRWHAWGGRRISGGLELGLIASYQNEPYPLIRDGFLVPSEVSGANHRLQLLLAAGHGLRLLRLTVGTHLFVGWTGLTAHGRLRNATHGIDQVVSGTNSELSFGAMLHARLRLTDALSLSLRVFLPVPNFAAGVSSLVSSSLGLSVRL